MNKRLFIYNPIHKTLIKMKNRPSIRGISEAIEFTVPNYSQEYSNRNFSN